MENETRWCFCAAVAERKKERKNSPVQPPVDSCTSWQSVIATLWKEYRRKKKTLLLFPDCGASRILLPRPTWNYSWNHTELYIIFNTLSLSIFFLSMNFSKTLRILLVSFNLMRATCFKPNTSLVLCYMSPPPTLLIFFYKSNCTKSGRELWMSCTAMSRCLLVVYHSNIRHHQPG